MNSFCYNQKKRKKLIKILSKQQKLNIGKKKVPLSLQSNQNFAQFPQTLSLCIIASFSRKLVNERPSSIIPTPIHSRGAQFRIAHNLSQSFSCILLRNKPFGDVFLEGRKQHLEQFVVFSEKTSGCNASRI